MMKGAPMRSGQLHHYFGVLGNTTSAYKVLKGTCVAPEGLSDSVVGMLQMIREVAVGVKGRIVDILITLQDYTQYWKGCMEKT